MKNRLVTSLLIIIIMINTAIPGRIYAANTGTNTGTFTDAQKHQQETGEDTVKQVFDEQTANINPSSGSRTEEVGETKSSSSTIAGVLGSVCSVLPILLNKIISLTINKTQTNALDMFGNRKYPNLVGNQKFTIEDAVMGRYYLFDVNFMDYNPNSTATIDVVKQNVARWYYSLRNIAIVGNLILLLYVGIRMAISTVAEEQAKYKKMFINWVLNFILLFTMHYVFLIVFEARDILLSMIGKITQGEGFEEQLINNIFNSFAQAKGWNGVVFVIEMMVFVYYQVKFFIVYEKRFFSVGFLFTISPLITLADAIYSVSSSAPIFKKWLKDIMFSIFIQVVHAIVYAVFILSAASIAKEIPIVGVLLLMTLSRTENIIKTTFSLDGKGLGEEKLIDKIKAKGSNIF